MREWHLTRINEGWKMTRIEGDAIAVRDLNITERFIFWVKHTYLHGLIGSNWSLSKCPTCRRFI